MNHLCLGQQPNSRVILLFVAWVLCRATLSPLQLWTAACELGKIREKRSPAYIVRASQAWWQACREGCAGCQAALQGGRQDPVCPCDTHGSQPWRPHAAEAAGISSSRGDAEQRSWGEWRAAAMLMQGSSIWCKVNTGWKGNWKFLSFPILTSANLGPKHMTWHSPFPPKYHPH